MIDKVKNFNLLAGFRVLDLANEIGMLCGKILGDLGAEVIKIEPPGGDPARLKGPFYKDIQDPEKSLSWMFANLNKRSVTLDLDTEAGRTVLRRLIKSADFVIESFDPGYLENKGLGFKDLRRLKPDIIMCSITPFGQTGPYAGFRATDLTLASLGGMAQLYGDPDRPPVRISEPQCFSLGAIHGAVGSVIAHYHRQKTGTGQHVDVSCQQAVVLSLMIAAEIWDVIRVNYQRHGSSSFSARPEPLGPLINRRIFPCKDGYMYALILGGAQAGLVASSKAITRMANEDGFALELQDYDWSRLDVSRVSQEEYNRVQDAIGAFIRTKTKKELFERAVKEGLLLVPINDVTDIAKSPQLAFRSFFVDVAHPELSDTITYPGFPVKIDGFFYTPQRRAPFIGEHNTDILSEENLPGADHPSGDFADKNRPCVSITADQPKHAQVFQGIKVVDFAWVAAGPQVARELAEHGATVIRVESHKRPDTLRLVTPFKDGIAGIDHSAFGMAYNTNKLGMSLDLGHPKARVVARRLVEWADLVSDSMTPGSMRKMGLDYDSCREIKPDIIYYSTCQMGQKGPLSNFGGYGAFGVAYGGFSHMTGWPDREPSPLFNNYSDFIAPWHLTSAVVLALEHRNRTGKGLYLDQSQIEAGVTFLASTILDYTVNGRVGKRRGNRDPEMAPHAIFPCQGDDRWAAVTVRNDAEWRSLCRVVEKPEWIDDDRFATLAGRKQNEDELERCIGEWTRNHPPDHVMEAMQAAGVPAGVVARPEDLFNDPQLAHRRHFRFLDHRVIGKAAHNAPAYILSETPNHIHKAGPCLGEDNEYIYKELLGFSDDEIAEFLVEGVITTEYDLPDVMKQGS